LSRGIRIKMGRREGKKKYVLEWYLVLPPSPPLSRKANAEGQKVKVCDKRNKKKRKNQNKGGAQSSFSAFTPSPSPFVGSSTSEGSL